MDAQSQVRPASIRIQAPGHQPLTVQIGSDEWNQPLLPQRGLYRLEADNLWIMAQDYWQEKPGLLLGLLSVPLLLAGLLARQRVLKKRNMALETMQLQGDLSGTKVGGYRLQHRLGRGGMAVVYLGIPDINLNEHHKVAVKIISEEAFETGGAQRFLREAAIGKSLQHPNLVEILDTGMHDSGRPFMVLEYLEGTSLLKAIPPNGMPSDQARELLITLARAMAYAHEKGVSHRDLKPENVMMCSNGQVKILDFGLARRADLTRLTTTGTIFGTPAYLPPEQILGSNTAYDQLSDQYSFGVMAYQMISGQLPFDGTDPMQVAYAHIEKEPPPITRADVPPALIEIVAKMMKKDPLSRFPDMAGVALSLEKLEVPAAHPKPGPTPQDREQSTTLEQPTVDLKVRQRPRPSQESSNS